MEYYKRRERDGIGMFGGSSALLCLFLKTSLTVLR